MEDGVVVEVLIGVELNIRFGDMFCVVCVVVDVVFERQGVWWESLMFMVVYVYVVVLELVV